MVYEFEITERDHEEARDILAAHLKTKEERLRALDYGTTLKFALEFLEWALEPPGRAVPFIPESHRNLVLAAVIWTLTRPIVEVGDTKLALSYCPLVSQQIAQITEQFRR